MCDSADCGDANTQRQRRNRQQPEVLTVIVGIPIARTLMALAMASLCARAEASISGSRRSIQDDVVSLRAIAREDAGPAGSTVVTLQTDSIVVREYLSPSGVVFAITWTGLVHPDLDTLLGP